MTGAEVVRGYWADMATNDFARAARWFAEGFELFWPQSQEVIRGREDFAALNAAYPAQGRWSFRIERLTGADGLFVSDVVVTDGAVEGRAVTFHWIEGGRIARQVEYWPDAFDAPDWRREWVSRGLPA